MRGLRVGLLAMLMALVTVPAFAQLDGPKSITAAQSGTCTGTGGFVFFPTGRSSSVTIDISGTFVATLGFFQRTNGIDWRAVNLATPTGTTASSTTAAGAFAAANLGLGDLCVTATAYTSGTAVVYLRQGFAGGAAGGGTASTGAFTSDPTITGADPSLAFIPATATDSRYAIGIDEDAASTDDDGFFIGKGAKSTTAPIFGVMRGASGWTNLTLAGNSAAVFTYTGSAKTDWRGLTIHDATGSGDPMLSGTGAGAHANSGLYLQCTNGVKSCLNFMVGGTTYAGVSGLNGSLFVTQDAAAKMVLDLESVATNDDPTDQIWQFRGATTDATPTAFATFTIPTSNTALTYCDVIARRTGGAAGAAEDGAAYRISVALKNTAGTVAEIAAETVTVVGESQAAWDVTAAPSTNTEVISVTGAVNNNITWHATCHFQMVGT